MATGPRYSVKFRRRREGKTNYKRRLKLILSKKPRVVVRKTNRYIIAHVTMFNKKGDKIVKKDDKALYVTSKELGKYGWNYSFKSTPAAYLTGLLLGKMMKELGVEEAILDIGLYRPIKGCKLYAFLKGLVDIGVNVPHDPEIFPDEKRITGEHIKEYAESIKGTEKFEKQFSYYIKNNLDPTKIPETFEKVKEKIVKE